MKRVKMLVGAISMFSAVAIAQNAVNETAVNIEIAEVRVASDAIQRAIQNQTNENLNLLHSQMNLEIEASIAELSSKNLTSLIDVKTNTQHDSGSILSDKIQYSVAAQQLQAEQQYELELKTAQNTVSNNNDLGIEEITTTTLNKSIQFHLYPNPATEYINIEVVDLLDNNLYEITIFDYSGKVIWKTNSYSKSSTIELESLPNGRYIVDVSVKAVHSATSFIKQ